MSMNETQKLTEVPDVGPELAKAIDEQLGISTIPELQAAAEDGALQALDGVGPKTEEKIVRGAKLHQAGALKRKPLEIARPVAENARDRLATHSAVERIKVAGSIRRRKNTIGDIDLVVQSDDGKTVFSEVAGWDAVDEVLARGDTKLSVRADTFQIDVRVVDDREFGAALQYFTGSQEHNIALRSRAKELGYKLNEYGLWNRETGDYVAGGTEREIYNHLGVEYPEPHEREDGHLSLEAETEE